MRTFLLFLIAMAALTMPAAAQVSIEPDTSGTFVFTEADTEFPDSRVLTGTANEVILTDNGAGSTLVISLNPSIGGWGTFDTNGILAQTSPGVYAGRTLTGTTNQITVTNGDGVSGNPTFSTPQDIHTTAAMALTSVDFGATTLLASRALTVDTGGVFDINLGTAAAHRTNVAEKEG